MFSAISPFFMIHAFNPKADPLKNIMDLSEQDTRNLLKALKRTTTFSGIDYYNRRVEVEAWLLSEAQKLGTKIDNQRPVYAALRDERPTHPKLDYVELDETMIDLLQCTFTIGDSFNNFQYNLTNGEDTFGLKCPTLGKLYTAASLLEEIEDLPTVIKTLEDQSNRLEVQIWCRPEI